MTVDLNGVVRPGSTEYTFKQIIEWLYALRDQLGSGSVSDGDKGDITVSSSGTVWTIDNGAVTASKVAADVATQAELDAVAATIPEVSDTAYGVSWDGVTDVAPSKNAVYDKIESLADPGFAAVNVQSGTTYTVQASDAGKIIVFTHGSPISVTLPDTLDDYFQFTVVQAGGGVPTITRSGTDTINGAATGVTPAAQWKGVYLTQYAAGSWLALL